MPHSLLLMGEVRLQRVLCNGLGNGLQLKEGKNYLEERVNILLRTQKLVIPANVSSDC